jgi:septal ring factor EnvC (AmiA/AmiB activator)
MKGFLITSAIVLFLALAGAVYYGVTLMHERDSLKGELASVQTTLAATQQELATTQADLTDTRAQLATKTAALTETEDELSKTQGTLATTQSTLTTTQATLTTTKATLATTKADLTSTQDELSTTRTDLVVAKSSLTSAESTNRQLRNDLDETEARLTTATQTLQGLGITLLDSNQCYDVALVDNAQAHDPTWAELKAFLAQDQTENHEYIANVYDCSQFSRDLHNRAEAAGIRCAEVQIQFAGEWAGHAVDAFLTTDYGLVYVDDTEPPDAVSRVVAGSTYRCVAITGFSPANLRNNWWWNSLYQYYYIPSSYGGEVVVQNILIYW